ncbi:phytanoyl-CoA dioxygenase family protein [Bradyrhizobium sp. Cham227]|nr:phytanoyl-CoA dioxygenase family protein [Bradyrhizobium brasilense]
MTSEERSAFAQDGYAIRKNLLSRKEAEQYLDRIRAPIEAEIKANKVLAKKDSDGRKALIRPIPNADEELLGFLGREERLVDLAHDVLGKPIYRFFAELQLKEPNVGGDGAWDWHQDFGFMFADGLLAPEMTTILIPFQKATKENGCMRLLKGSHKLGRLNHNTDLVPNRSEYCRVTQTSVEEKALKAAMERFEIVNVQLEPGDAFIWDANLIHGSNPNCSNGRLWSYICYYNAIDNKHYKADHEYGHYEPLNPAKFSSYFNA